MTRETFVGKDWPNIPIEFETFPFSPCLWHEQEQTRGESEMASS